MRSAQPSGFVAHGWESVADALAASVANGDDVGAGVAVYHRGTKVVDVTAGRFAPDSDRPYDHGTLQLVFSTTKGITAIAVAMCVQRGQLGYDDKVADHWPEFAAEGKQDATIRQLLSHQCGLITVDGITLEECLDREVVTARLAATAPDWPIGCGHGYHALSYGWLAGELVRRADGRTLGQFVADEIVAPLGVELWIGLPAEYEERVSPVLGGLGVGGADVDPQIKAMLEMFIGPGTKGGRALTMSGAFVGDGVFNRREVHAAEIPAANAITTAGALAKIYAATMTEVDGVRLLDDAVLNEATSRVTPPNEPDQCLIMPTAFSAGFMVHDQFSPYAGPGSFGHPGAGGSVAFAQPSRELAMSYVMNQMAPNLAADQRAAQLIGAATAVIDRL